MPASAAPEEADAAPEAAAPPEEAGDQFLLIENSFTSFFFPAPGPTLFLP